MNTRAILPAIKSFIMITAISLGGCGGGGGESAAPPTISNLSYAPSSVIYQSAGRGEILGTMSYSDPADQLASIRITSSSGLDATIPVSGESGHTSGAVTGLFQVSTTTIGHFPFEIWVVDGNGKASNHLSGSFDVVANVGANWTARPSMTAADLRRVAWSGSMYAAVGAGGAIVTSPDGSTWTPRTSGTTNSLYGITWTGAEFVAVGDRNRAHLDRRCDLGGARHGTHRCHVAGCGKRRDGTRCRGGQGNGSGANPGGLKSLIPSCRWRYLD